MCLTNNYNIIMEQINFEWDENKNIINQKKHNATKKQHNIIKNNLQKVKML